MNSTTSFAARVLTNKQRTIQRNKPNQKNNTPWLPFNAPTGGAMTGRQSSSGGGVRCVGDVYYMSADVSQFEPHDVVVMAYNHQVVIHAAKVMDDGTVGDTFTHKSLFPDDMDPLSICGTFSPDGVLVVRVHRTTALGEPEPLATPVYRSEAHL
uniref:SHSP domain-containing protein n=1 Tax=Sphaeramia orbicularis TaxID=375764 RepID=A0A672ZG47_9TELE